MSDIDWTGLLGLLGMFSMCFALVVLALLSQRLGRVTNAASYYLGFYVAAGLVTVGIAARIAHLDSEVAVIAKLHQNIGWVLLYNGAPAAGVTLGVTLAWRYWSWLLAERS